MARVAGVRSVLMVAGEPSGDVYGAGVVKELRSRHPDVEVFGIGGDAMAGAGMDILFHISRMAFMGFAEVVRNLGLIRKVEREMEQLLDIRRPQVAVLIDYPGFNLRFARKIKDRGIKVLYYVSPQVWAWHKSRVKTMRGLVDRMKVAFPFEVPIYEQAGIDVEFVGHPLAERIASKMSKAEFCAQNGLNMDQRIIALLPGSRVQEICRILPVVAAAARELQMKHEVQICIGAAPGIGDALLQEHLPDGLHAVIVRGQTHDLMRHANMAIVTSGTATLETGWFATPMVIVYRTSVPTYLIGRLLVDVAHIGLVNIVLGERVVPELLQGGMTVEAVVREASRFLTDAKYEEETRIRLSSIKDRLGSPGASARVTNAIEELVLS